MPGRSLRAAGRPPTFCPSVLAVPNAWVATRMSTQVALEQKPRATSRNPPQLAGSSIYNPSSGAPGATRTRNLRIRRTVSRNNTKQAILTYGLCSGDAFEPESICRLWDGQ